MKTLGRRALRHLSFANLLACIALFVALGGVGYAAATINGNKIVKQSIGAGKLKKGTLTSAQVKANGLDGSVIDESTLNIVPSAQSASSSQTAVTAQTARSAETATSAKTADSAETAKTADSATTATSAETADQAESLDGFTADELQLSCPADTTLYGGMCWDDEVRPFKFWIGATIECGEAGGRLPSLGELIAYVAQPDTQVTGPNWSGDVIDLPGGQEHVLTRDETTTGSSSTEVATFGFRCVFYRAN